MTDQDKITAVQAVVDRVTSYQDGTTEGTLEAELRKGLDEAGVELGDDEVARLVAAMEADAGETDAGAVLG